MLVYVGVAFFSGNNSVSAAPAAAQYKIGGSSQSNTYNHEKVINTINLISPKK